MHSDIFVTSERLPGFRNVWAADFDVPFSAVNRSIAIISTPRTGSQAVCRLLYKAGLGIPAEYFLPAVINTYCSRFLSERPPLTPRFMADYSAALRERRCRDGVFSYKIHAHQHRHLQADLGTAYEDTLPNLSIVRLRRLNVVAQVVSFGAALQTGKWEAAPREHRPRKLQGVSEPIARRWTDYIFRSEKYWDRYVARTGHSVMSILQEDLANLSTMSEFLGALGASLPDAAIRNALGDYPITAHNQELTADLSRRFGDLIAQHWSDLEREAATDL